MGYLLTEILSK